MENDIEHPLIKDLNPQLKDLKRNDLVILKNLLSEYTDRPTSKILAEISARYRLDIASYFFLQYHHQIPQNQKLYQQYRQHFSNIVEEKPLEGLAHLREHFIAFVPGFAYKEDTTTGADFARQRSLLTNMNINHQLIEIEEWGLVENNAKFIASTLENLCTEHEEIIVVSASKGGLETSIALGKYANPDKITPLKHWISVGGILQGSPLADGYLSGYKYWFSKFMLWIKKKDPSFLKEISFQYRSETFKTLNFPAHIQRIHFVGIPIASAISDKIKKRHGSMLHKYGPNDGLTPLAEEVTDGGIVIAELGLDHYFQHPQIDQKTLALALMAID